MLPAGLNRPHAASVAGLGGSSFSQLLGHSAGFSGSSTGSTSAADAWAGFQSWVQAKRLSAGSGLRYNYRGPACAYSFSESYARHQVPGSYAGQARVKPKLWGYWPASGGHASLAYHFLSLPKYAGPVFNAYVSYGIRSTYNPFSQWEEVSGAFGRRPSREHQGVENRAAYSGF